MSACVVWDKSWFPFDGKVDPVPHYALWKRWHYPRLHMSLSAQLFNVKISAHSWGYSLDSDKCIIKRMLPKEGLENVFIMHFNPFNFGCKKEITKATFAMICHYKTSPELRSLQTHLVNWYPMTVCLSLFW